MYFSKFFNKVNGLVTFSITVTDTREKQLEGGKVCCGLWFREVQHVHDHLAPAASAGHHDRRSTWGKRDVGTREQKEVARDNIPPEVVG